MTVRVAFCLWAAIFFACALHGVALAEFPGPEHFPGQERTTAPKGTPILFSEYGSKYTPAGERGDRFLYVDTREYCKLLVDVSATHGIKAVITVRGTSAFNNRFVTFDEVAPIVADAEKANELGFFKVIVLRHSYTEISVKRVNDGNQRSDGWLAVYLTPMRCGVSTL